MGSRSFSLSLSLSASYRVFSLRSAFSFHFLFRASLLPSPLSSLSSGVSSLKISIPPRLPDSVCTCERRHYTHKFDNVSTFPRVLSVLNLLSWTFQNGNCIILLDFSLTLDSGRGLRVVFHFPGLFPWYLSSRSSSFSLILFHSLPFALKGSFFLLFMR